VRTILIGVAAVFAMLANSFSEGGNVGNICVCSFEAPLYSALARQAGLQGTVQVSVQLDATGKPVDARVVGEPHPLLDESAVRAVRDWRFCVVGARTRAGEVSVIFDFRLRGAPTQNWSATEVQFGSGRVEITAPPANTRQY
jgi:TonB family protein